MFDCSFHLRDSTHLDLYKTDIIDLKCGINGEDMILIDLMSGDGYVKFHIIKWGRRCYWATIALRVAWFWLRKP